MSHTYTRRVHFYETDLMGIVHHANYLRYFEECRVAWLNERDSADLKLWNEVTLAVLETSVQHKGAARFNDIFTVKMQIKRDGIRFFFRYALSVDNKDGKIKLAATGQTVHALLNRELKVCKPPEALIKLVEKESWTETWP